VRSHIVHAPVADDQCQDSLVLRGIEIIVPDVVHYMPWPLKQHVVQVCPCRLGDPVNFRQVPD
jgi:hypothetical protein